jgi:GGDEF domain-containing protein
MLLDLDRFKAVNDTMVRFGDLLLKAVADRLKLCVREVDTVGRMGGDEVYDYPGLYHGAGHHGRGSADCESLGEPFELGRITHRLASASGLPFILDDHDIDDLLKHADAAMYRPSKKVASTFQFHIHAKPQSPLISQQPF